MLPQMKRPSSSSSNSCGSKNTNVVFCNHNMGVIMSTAKKGPHVGKKFYGSSLWPHNGCGFFQSEEMQADVTSKSMTSDIEIQIKNYEAKLKKQKLKNEKLKLEVSILKVKVDKHFKGEKIVMFGLIFSWIIFAFSWMFMC
ncbi:hypothetical protein RND81_08G057300 [Saponaria officinalis]|uniref:GRF-type domain-containing protein n=1 Tax=Saponaria officinalis TaxID=3572 RepID=A0AAW1J3Y1_SAPOF